jgi:hypothetical protein
MPIMMRKFVTPKAQKILDDVMEVAQEFGSDINNLNNELPKSSKKKRKSEEKGSSPDYYVGDYNG